MVMTFGIVGYSTRALAQAVTELGHRAICIDAFGDQDTIDCADVVHVIDDWPHGIARLARSVNVDGWLLGGGMENCVDTWASSLVDSPVLGPSSDDMRTLRSLEFLESVCNEEVRWPTSSLEQPEDYLGDLGVKWLIKPLRSAGGVSVRWATQADSDRDCYWQRSIAGRGLGATWIMRDGSCRLIGVTQAFQEPDWQAPSPFIYRGSFGPIKLREPHLRALESLGQRIRKALPNYRGLLQADLIEDASQQLWLLEFNPRWTAGMEILHEAASKMESTPLAAHLNAWGIIPARRTWQKPSVQLASKAIYYSPIDLDLTQACRLNLQSLRSWQSSLGHGYQWCLADVPPVTPTAPMRFSKGNPILTVKCRFV